MVSSTVFVVVVVRGKTNCHSRAAPGVTSPSSTFHVNVRWSPFHSFPTSDDDDVGGSTRGGTARTTVTFRNGLWLCGLARSLMPIRIVVAVGTMRVRMS